LGQDNETTDRMCYVCTGRFPDRDCELYPQYVTMGPGKMECPERYCSTTVRYKPKKHLMKLDTESNTKRTVRPLTTTDFVVDSIARDCDEYGSRNNCEMNQDDLTITCQESCDSGLCNSGLPAPESYVIKNSAFTEDPVIKETTLPEEGETTKRSIPTTYDPNGDMYDKNEENSLTPNDTLTDSMGYDDYTLVDKSGTRNPGSKSSPGEKDLGYEYQGTDYQENGTVIIYSNVATLLTICFAVTLLMF